MEKNLEALQVQQAQQGLLEIGFNTHPHTYTHTHAHTHTYITFMFIIYEYYLTHVTRLLIQIYDIDWSDNQKIKNNNLITKKKKTLINYLHHFF